MVAERNRFKRSQPCPICKGYDSQARGQGKRCHGFMSDDGEWVHCTRQDYANGLTLYPESRSYAHKFYGDCKCGVTHNPPLNNGMMTRDIKEYDYTDEYGKVLYQVCRKNPKGFFQRRPNGKSGWINNLEGVQRVLYRLPELLKADQTSTVFICEGEKDADALIERGLLATTNASGAEKWRHEYNEALRGRSVVILPDNDEPGRKHAEQVAKSLNGIAASVRIVELPDLPDKGDVSDFFTAGGTVEQLQEILSSATNSEVTTVLTNNILIQSAAELLARELPEPKFAVNGLLSEGVTIFAGKPKLGKSWLGLGMAIAVASGGYVLGAIKVKQGDVLYLALEDGERRLQDRLQRILGNEPAPERLNLATEWKRLNEGGLEDLEAWLKGNPDARLVVIDTLKRVRQRRSSGKAQLYDIDYEALEPLGILARKYSISVVVIHHTRKAESEDPLDLISGSFGLTGSADGALILKRARGQNSGELHVTGRDFEEQALALNWDNAIYGWKIVGDAEELCLGRERKEIIDLIYLDGAKTPKEVAKDLKRNDSATRKLMARMFADGQLNNDGSGLYSLPEKKSNGNCSNSGNYSNLGNAGNSGKDSANNQQSYLEFEAGNSVNSTPDNSLASKVTGVTTVTMDSEMEEEIAERAAIYEFDGGYTREQAEEKARAAILNNLAATNSQSGGIISVNALFDEEEKAA